MNILYFPFPLDDKWMSHTKNSIITMHLKNFDSLCIFEFTAFQTYYNSYKFIKSFNFMKNLHFFILKISSKWKEFCLKILSQNSSAFPEYLTSYRIILSYVMYRLLCNLFYLHGIFVSYAFIYWKITTFQIQ